MLSQMRTELANRLVLQQQDHVVALQLLAENFLAPCLRTDGADARASLGDVPRSALRSIFGNVPALLREQRALLAATSDAIDVLGRRGGRLLAPRLRTVLALVRTYAANLARATAALERARADSRFDRFLERTAVQAGQPLDELLLEPLRQLFRYRALLYAWLKCSQPHHSDRSALLDAYRQVNRTLDFVHERNAEQSFFAVGKEGGLTEMANSNEG